MNVVRKILQSDTFKEKWWLSKWSHVCLMLFLIFIIPLSTFIYCKLNFWKSFEGDKNALYEQAKILENDFSKIKEMDNVRCDFCDEKKEVTLVGEYGYLSVYFNEEFTKIEDYDDITNGFIIFVILPFISSVIFVLVVFLGIILMVMIGEKGVNTLFNIILVTYLGLVIKIIVEKFLL